MKNIVNSLNNYKGIEPQRTQSTQRKIKNSVFSMSSVVNTYVSSVVNKIIEPQRTQSTQRKIKNSVFSVSSVVNKIIEPQRTQSTQRKIKNSVFSVSSVVNTYVSSVLKNKITTKTLCSLCTLWLTILLNAQSTNQNHIKTTTYKVATTTSITNPTPQQAVVTVGYFDGLGRPIQQVAHQQSSTGKDIVTHIEYDAFGRQTKEFLPYSSSTASLDYKTSAATDVASFYNTNYYENTTNPYSEKLLEASPLNRVLKQAAPGNAWALGTGKEIKLDCQTNVANDQVRLYNITTTWDVAKGLYELPATLPSNVFYANGELYKTITYDENSAGTNEEEGSTIEFKDKQGRVILKRTYSLVKKTIGNGNVGATYWVQEAHDTYYVYDQYNNLTYVIPPLVDTNVAIISQTTLNNLCYQYKYDYRNRLVEKKLPGKTWEFIVYDKLDRVRATGPTYSPFNTTTPQQGWLITKYDVFNRPVLTGFVQTNVTSTTRKTLQDTFTAATINFNESKSPTASTSDSISYNYSNVSWPTAFNLLTVNYYDNYSFPYAPSPVPTTITDLGGEPVLANVKTLATGSFTRVCTSTSATAGETTYTLYDDKARPIGVYTKNHLGGHTNTVSKLDFAGQVQYSLQKHKRTNTSTEITVKETFTYSPQGRLLTHTHKINNKPEEVLARNEYDELGQLITNKIGGATTNTNGLQQVNTKYNIRGWLTQINDINTLGNDLFAFKINYNNPDANYQGTALYNGNISQTHWRTSSNNILKSYGYTYDGLNRLLNAKYYAGTDPTNTDRYNENLQYDKNGNITSLLRYGSYNTHKQLIDVLNYEYTGNQLMNVNEASNGHLVAGFKDGNVKATTNLNDYQYDDFGNMIIDRNKGISNINYNHLNLPRYIVFNNNNQTSIHYTYNAARQKVKKVANLGTTNNVSGTSLTDYLGGYQYNNDVLQFFPHAQGYVKHTVNPSNGASEFDYVYQYKDHLGNIRINYTFDTATSSLRVLEENHYYPFGLKHQENLQPRSIRFAPSPIISNEWVKGVGYLEPMPVAALVPNGGYQYKYNGKEWQDELGLSWYDYGNRNYDSAIGRFKNMDRYSEKYYHMNPYQYGGSNPIIFNDIKGDSILIYSKKDNFNVKYENGNLYSQNSKTKKWEAYNGKNIKVDKNGNKSITGFLGKAVAGLDRIRTGGTKGSQLISDLQNSTKYIRLNEGKNQANGTSGTVNWDPSSTNGGPNQNGNHTREPFIALAHELAHAHDGLRGPLNETSIGMIGNTSIPFSEFYAMDWENQVRSENNFALRTHYGDDANGNVIGQNFQRFSFSTVQLQANFSNTGDLKIVPVSSTSTMVIPITKY